MGSVVFILFCYLLVSAWSNAVNLIRGKVRCINCHRHELIATNTQLNQVAARERGAAGSPH